MRETYQKDESTRQIYYRGFVENTRLSGESKIARGRRFGLDLTARFYRCAIVAPVGDANDNVYSLLQGYQSRCEGFASKYACRFYPYTDSHDFIVILIAENDSAESSELIFRKMHGFLTGGEKAAVRIGVGSAYTDPAFCNVSREEAEEALKQPETQKESVVFAQDYYRVMNHSTSNAGALMRDILLDFREGEIKRLQKNVETLVEATRMLSRVEPGTPYPTSIRRIFVALTDQILQVASDANLDVEDIIGDKAPYAIIFGFAHTTEITEWFIELCQTLKEAIAEKKQKSESSLVRLVCSYIEENLQNQDIGLASLSIQAQVSPSYLSRLFSREMGQGINQYIREKRLSKASQMIQNSELKIAEIAELTGFRSVNYFTTMFKSYTGMTPAVFRKRGGHRRA